VFEECVGLIEAECLEIVHGVLTENTDFLPVGAQSVDSFIANLKVERLRARTSNAADSNLVGLRTDYDEEHVVGILGDGMVFYPFPWCTTEGTS